MCALGRMPVQTRSSRIKTVPGLNPFAAEFDECKMVNAHFAKCKQDDAVYEEQQGIPAYNKFVKELIKKCKPYQGKRVFVIKNKNRVSYVCPDYTLGDKFTVSLAKRGYVYVHYLKEHMPTTSDCVYKGDHLTIAPSGDKNIHFHLTHIYYQVEDNTIIEAHSYNTSYCSLPIADMLKTFKDKKMSIEDKKEWFENQMCMNEYNVSFNMNVKQMLREKTDMVDMVFDIMMKGVPAPAKASKTST